MLLQAKTSFPSISFVPLHVLRIFTAQHGTTVYQPASCCLPTAPTTRIQQYEFSTLHCPDMFWKMCARKVLSAVRKGMLLAGCLAVLTFSMTLLLSQKRNDLLDYQDAGDNGSGEDGGGGRSAAHRFTRRLQSPYSTYDRKSPSPSRSLQPSGG